MITLDTLREAVGVSALDQSLIRYFQPALLNEEPAFEEELYRWSSHHLKISEGLLLPHFYLSFIQGRGYESFYAVQYQQGLAWRNLGISETQTLLILSQIRHWFIAFCDARTEPKLAQSLCRIMDLSQAVIASVFTLAREMQQKKRRAAEELKRLQRSFDLVGAALPRTLIDAYTSHQNWKITAYALALGEQQDNDLELSPQKCGLGIWILKQGAQELSAEDLAALVEAHNTLHMMVRIVLEESQQNHPELILSHLREIDEVSEFISEVLLELIDKRFAHLALEDALTSLPNRRAFDIQLREKQAFAQRHGFNLGIILLDIDHFKRINDSLGHEVGDEVLQVLSRTLLQSLRKEDGAFRWGGEEFVVLTLDKSLQGLHELAERLRQDIAQKVYLTLPQGEVLSVTASLGALSFEANLPCPMHEIFSMVDKLLYQAKDAGRNQVKCAILDSVHCQMIT